MSRSFVVNSCGCVVLVVVGGRGRALLCCRVVRERRWLASLPPAQSRKARWFFVLLQWVWNNGGLSLNNGPPWQIAASLDSPPNARNRFDWMFLILCVCWLIGKFCAFFVYFINFNPLRFFLHLFQFLNHSGYSWTLFPPFCLTLGFHPHSSVSFSHLFFWFFLI